MLGTAIAVLGLNAARYWPFIADDALISLRYAKRLLQGHGLTWDSYDPVEGYSNLLWILANAGLGSVGVDLVTSSRVLGALAMVAAVVACGAAARRFDWPGVLPLAGSAFVLALSGSIAVWLVGGLEQGFLAAFLAWSLVLVQQSVDREERRRTLVAGLLLALLVLTRADAPVLVAALAGALWCARGFERKDLWLVARLVVLPVVAFVGQLGFRILYYGDWLPNTARVKLALTWTRVQSGSAYVATGFVYLSPILLTAALMLHPRVRRHRSMRRLLVPLISLVTWSAYVAFVGGDIFPARRQLVPVVVALALIVGEVVAATVRARGRWRSWAWPAVAVVLLLFAWAQLRDPENRRAIDERWEWDGQAIAGFYRQAFGTAQPLLATAAAGCLPYWSELPSLDMLGLNDRRIARSRPAGYGEGPLGHEVGDGEYVLSREPDLVVEGLSVKRTDQLWTPGARQMRASPEWSRQYVRVRFRSSGSDFYTYVRRTSEKIGILAGPDSVRVPGFLFATGKDSAAGLDPDGVLALVLGEATPAGSLPVELGAGRWQLDVETGGEPGGQVLLLVHRPGAEPREFGVGDTLELPAAGALLTTLVTPDRGPLHVRVVSFRKQ